MPIGLLRFASFLSLLVNISTDHPSLSSGVLADGAASATESSDSGDDSVLSESSLVTTEKDALPDFTASLVCSQQPGVKFSSILLSAIRIIWIVLC